MTQREKDLTALLACFVAGGNLDKRGDFTATVTAEVMREARKIVREAAA